MATYNIPCLRCGTFIGGDSAFCPACGSRFPFGYACPGCLREIRKGEALCSGCGRPLYIQCPHCLYRTFVQDSCEHCGASLMVLCKNKRCGVPQFHENKICTACGKKLPKR